MDVRESPVRFNHPILTGKKDENTPVTLNRTQSEDCDILVKYSHPSQQDPRIRVKMDTEDVDDWFQFNITDSERRMCAPHQSFENLPADVTTAVYACGYYIPELDEDLNRHHTTLHLVKTLEYVSEFIAEYKDIPLLRQSLVDVHMTLTSLYTLGSTLMLVDETVFIESLRECREERGVFPDDFHMKLKEKSDINLGEFDPDEDGADVLESGDVAIRTDDTMAEAALDFTPCVNHDCDVEDMTIFDIHKRKQVEWATTNQLDNGDLLVISLSPLGFTHLYLAHQTGDRYVCETPNVDHLDPPIEEMLFDMHPDITITNIDSVSNVETPVDLLDHSLSVVNTLQQHYPDITEGFTEDAKRALEDSIIPSAAVDAIPDAYRQANAKAADIYEDQTDMKHIENLQTTDDGFEFLYTIIYRMLHKKHLLKLQTEFESQMDQRKNFRPVEQYLNRSDTPPTPPTEGLDSMQ